MEHHIFCKFVPKKIGELTECFQRYQQDLKETSSIDLDDIVYYFYEIIKNDKTFREMMQGYKYIMVDECQDTNPIQYEILKLIRGSKNHLFFCGDDDQSIYAFRGADPFLVKRFIDEYHPNQIVLEINYRSLPQVIEASSNIIKNNLNRVPKVYKSVKKRNAMIEVIRCNNNRHEGIQLCSIINQFINHGYEYKDIAILFRNSNIADHLEPYFLKYGIPHTKTRLNYLECEEIKTILNYYRFLNDPNNDLYLENLLKNKLFKLNLVRIRNNAHKNKISLFEQIKLEDEINIDAKYFLDK